MFACHKNSYLQCTTQIQPRVINKCVDKAREKPTIDAFDSLPPFQRVQSHQPCIPIANCEVTRRPLAFERKAMPKLLKELSSLDQCIVKQAITSVCDMIHNPEYNFQAIQLRFPERLLELLDHPDAEVRERTFIALTTIGDLLDGKYAIIKNTCMLDKIKECMKDNELAVRMQLFTMLEKISLVWMVADYLVENNYVEELVDILQRMHQVEDRDVLTLIMQTLEHLMYCNGKTIAFQSGFFDVLVEIIKTHNEPNIIGAALKCLSILLQLEEGKRAALKAHLLKKLFRCLLSEIPVIYANAAAAMVFATIKIETLVKAVKIPGLVDRLITLAKAVHQPSTQKYCMQILTNLTGHGDIKKYLLDERVEELEAIYVGEDEHAKRVKEILLVDSLKF